VETVEDLIEDAHRAATQMDSADLVADLQETLGQKIVAFAIGDRHPKTVGRYARGERTPDGPTIGKLVDLQIIVGILRQGMRDESVKAWMMGKNPRLKGKAPIEAVHEDHAYEVMGAAKAFVTRR
jgi:hypothetical protein